MSVFDWLRGEFAKFGLAPLPLHDADFPDEPSATVTRLADRVRPTDTSARDELRVHTCVDGRPHLSPGAAGTHPSQWPTDWRQQLGHIRNIIDELIADHDAGRININT